MHDGEGLYIFNKWDALFALIVMGLTFALFYKGKMPSVSSFRDFINIWNSRGGNIVLLSAMTWYFFRASMRMFYHLVALISTGKLDSKEGITQLFVAFATNTAFSFCFGALVKTMTGSEGGTPVPPVQPASSVSTTTSTSITSNEPPKPAAGIGIQPKP